MDLTERVYRGAIESLRRCSVPHGLKASGLPRGHRQIWARDSMISLLGARFIPDDRIQCALHASLSSLKRHRSSTGQIPNHVDCETGRANFRAYADGGLWWVVGSTLLAPDPSTVRTVLAWYACQDVDGTGLLQMQEGSDWQDLFCTRGKGLCLNALYVIALRAAARQMAQEAPQESEGFLRQAARVADQVNRLFWYRGDGCMLPHIAHTFSTEDLRRDSLGRERWIPQKRQLVDEQYYLPYLGFRAFGEWFDSFANLLAILSGVAGPRQTGAILDFIERHSLNAWPLRSLTPAVRPGDPDWRDYYGALNLPHQYHNGGVWPFIGGFYVAALVKAGRQSAAERALRSLAELNERGGFNEWHHGESGAPMGVNDQAWSAGMYVFAFECVRTGRVDLP
ncbi:MAG TPA: amylo-alpha-1,6-glucosidase [Bryobacteraceae bacterium]|nr:amylo-alpha-1,6-glucosidase [Bryobacteraceae bacterium]